MTEAFLHYIWQHQYFDKAGLATFQGEPVTIYKPGFYNTNAGPDFEQAKLKMGELQWVGSVEIHLKSSDYLAHRHQHNAAYDNVVLHVVWHHDTVIKHADGTVMPTIELSGRVEAKLKKDYKQLVNSAFKIPCAKSLPGVSDLVKTSAVEQAAIRRVNAKAHWILELHQANKGDWDATFYQALGRNFGFKINAEPFLALVQSLHLNTLAKHSGKVMPTEALLFGMAGLLENPGVGYPQSLKTEFEFLSKKYGLEIKLSAAQWRFLRLRPANFPTLRIAQFAAVMQAQPRFFAAVLETTELKSMRALLEAPVSEYWERHYSFRKKSAALHHQMGATSIDNIIINTVVPALAGYATRMGESRFFDRALEFMAQLPAEKNSLTALWQPLGLANKSAFDSQGLIEQVNNFCKKRQCLHCAIGASILKPNLA